MSFKKRAPRAVKEIRKFAEKAMVCLSIFFFFFFVGGGGRGVVFLFPWLLLFWKALHLSLSCHVELCHD